MASQCRSASCVMAALTATGIVLWRFNKERDENTALRRQRQVIVALQRELAAARAMASTSSGQVEGLEQKLAEQTQLLELLMKGKERVAVLQQQLRTLQREKAELETALVGHRQSVEMTMFELKKDVDKAQKEVDRLVKLKEIDMVEFKKYKDATSQKVEELENDLKTARAELSRAKASRHIDVGSTTTSAENFDDRIEVTDISSRSESPRSLFGHNVATGSTLAQDDGSSSAHTSDSEKWHDCTQNSAYSPKALLGNKKLSPKREAQNCSASISGPTLMLPKSYSTQ